MSTYIGDAVKVPYTDMWKLIELSQDIQERELTNLREYLKKEAEEIFTETVKAEFRKFGVTGPYREFRSIFSVLTAILKECGFDFMLADKVNEPLIPLIQKIYPGFAPEDIDSIFKFAKVVSRANPTLHFYPTRHGFTIMQHYSLTSNTEKWIKESFDDFMFQDSTEGPGLKELNPDMDYKIRDWGGDRIENVFIELGLLEDDEKAMKAKESILDSLCSSVAHVIYRERDKVWNECLTSQRGNSPWANSLSFDILKGLGAKMSINVDYAIMHGSGYVFDVTKHLDT